MRWFQKTPREQILFISKIWGFMWLASVLIGIHGFSLPMWRHYVGEPGYEPVLGHERDIRSDDWLVLAPLSMIQRKTTPPFPIVNPLIGNGQNMLVVVTAPVLNQVTLFRPHTWGYFVGSDFGLSWAWNFYVYGFLFSFFFLFLLCTKNSVLISAVGSIALLFSPFFQFWALNSAALAAEGALSIVLAAKLFLTRKNSLFLGLSLGWSLSCFAYWIYPAFQVPLTFIGVCIFVGLIFRHLQEGEKITWSPNKSLGIALAVMIPIGSLFFFYHDAREAIYQMYHTVYPGQRFSGGGGFSLWSLFLNNLIPLRLVKQYAAFGNLCEAASSILIYPLVMLVVFWDSWKNKAKIDPVIIGLVAALLWLTAWVFIPMPRWLALMTLFSRVPESRSVIGHDFANIALLVTVSALSFQNMSLDWKKIAWRRALPWMLGWSIFMMMIFPSALAISHDYKWPRLSVWILYAAVTSLSLGLAVGLRHRATIALLCFFHLGLSFSFNPLVIGGSAIFEKSKVSQAILNIQNPPAREAKWIMVGDGVMAMFLRTMGLHTLNGNFFYPQWEIWNKLDPHRQFENAYNRYTFMNIYAKKSISEFKIHSPYSDVTEVHISPNDPRLMKLDFDYIFSRGKLQLASGTPLKEVLSEGPFTIYRRTK